jgi:hypothetical protein
VLGPQPRAKTYQALLPLLCPRLDRHVTAASCIFMAESLIVISILKKRTLC